VTRELGTLRDRDVDLQPVVLKHTAAGTGDGQEGHPRQSRVQAENAHGLQGALAV
jgi:hypothetical protein